MGAWGVGPFANDDALDLLGDADEAADPVAPLRAALTEAGEPGYLDADVVGRAVAAAALVAAAAGGPAPDSPEGRDWLAEHPFAPDAALLGLAARALDRALDPRDNEWWELWDEAGTTEDVRAALAPYRAALGA